MHCNYFSIDGSALTAQIRQLWRGNPALNRRRLSVALYVSYLMNSMYELHGRSYKRFTFYFPKGDEAAVEDFLELPNYKKPAGIRDVHIKFCGQKLKRSDKFKQFVETQVPTEFHDRCSKSEKGIDIEICCDAFKLAAHSQLDRLFLFTNDDDFIPFCRAIKEFGANVSIIHLSDTVTRNLSLLREADSYDVVPEAAHEAMFLPMDNPTVPESLPAESLVQASGLKPLADTADFPLGDLEDVSTLTAPSEIRSEGIKQEGQPAPPAEGE